MNPITIFLIVFTILVVTLSLFPSKELQVYWSRSCTGRNWKRAFPDFPKSDIRTFLTMFANCFFEPKRALFFRPEDKIMDIYNAIYSGPGHIGGDACECESFVSEFVKTYGKDPTIIWSADLTLGQLFTFAHATHPPSNPGPGA